MTAPYLGAPVLVNVDPAHNGGEPVAPGTIVALHPDGTVNVRVLYNSPPGRHAAFHHRPEWLEDVTFHDTTDPAAAMRQGLYGAFWPDGPDLATILQNQEKIMTAQDDINAAVAAIQAVAADLTSAASAIQAEVAQLNAELTAAGSATVDTSALNAAIAPLQAAQAAVDALKPAAAAPAAPAETVSGGDTGSAA